MDSTGRVFVSEMSGNRTRLIDTSGQVSTYAGTSVSGSLDASTATQASFASPYHLAVDASGNVFVADTGNNLIRQITPGGVVSTYAGVRNPSNAVVNGPALSATFNAPYGVVVDTNGYAYVADRGHNLLRLIVP